MTFEIPTYEQVRSDEEVKALQERFEDASAVELLRWAHAEFGDEVALASSFGLEDVVLVDLIDEADVPIRIFTLDTGRLHQETYDVISQIRERYDLQIETYFPEREKVEEMLREKGPNSFYESREERLECCFIRKVAPLNRALSSCQAWITGLRRDQNVTRQGTPKVEIDRSHGNILKLNPIADWKQDDVTARIEARDIPYNELHDRSYPSIGCAPCTRAVEPGEHRRAGRWWWEEPESRECGLHTEKKTGESS